MNVISLYYVSDLDHEISVFPAFLHLL